MTLRTSPAPVYQQANELYYVRSSSTPNLYYAVVNQDRIWRCDCAAGKHGRNCWHVRACIDGMVKPARLTRQPQDTAPRTPTVWERGHHGDLYQ